MNATIFVSDERWCDGLAAECHRHSLALGGWLGGRDVTATAGRVKFLQILIAVV